ncbi:short-chain dehydrogenase [Pseudidiomarina aquimaris]|uniref:Short-chain dehydrogenase n=1 Tax=Pseudidiomarina aquimaris TaxID=641841 RepID=A0A432XCX9_9GAMM|nr:SDR family oxidoreductase [Pseudidiomarina aquimaris]RUO46614.1 short-chain dehydrogenase [Pseudidiomarina aquimaris]
MNLFDRNSFSGKKILITGASSGIGAHTAVKLSQLGCQLILGGRNLERLNGIREKLDGDNHELMVGELRDADNTYQLISDAVERVGPLDGIFHSAGIETVLPARLVKQRNVDEIFAASVFAGFGVARAASKKNIMKDAGSLVFMSSVASLTGQAGYGMYSASKSAIDGLTRSLACEVAQRKIRVNSVNAGAVLTEMLEKRFKNSGSSAQEELENRHLLGLGKTSDVANAVIFLLSDGSNWITGSSLRVDGGYTVR